MSTLRQFIYLDEYKMYSLYSQLFEGFTDYVVKYAEEQKSDAEEQKGPIGSGRFVADLAISKAGQRERRFLHDYAYTLFEAELGKQRTILIADVETEAPQVAELTPGSFIKVTGATEFNDMKVIAEMINRFNEFGQAITLVTTQEERAATQKEAEEAIRNQGDRNVRARLKAAAKASMDIKRLAQQTGLQQDEAYLKAIAYLLQYGYADHFEIQVRPGTSVADAAEPRFFSALLKRDCLREEELFLVKKHARHAYGQFSLFGIVCQAGETPTDPTLDESELKYMKEALRRMVFALSGIENSFFGRLQDEVIVDPIAVYREV